MRARRVAWASSENHWSATSASRRSSTASKAATSGLRARARRRHREARQREELARPRQGARHDLVDGGELVDEADAQRLVGPEQQAADAEARRLSLSDDVGERAQQHLRHRQADADLVEADAVLSGGEHAVVREEREHRAARGAVARERRRDRDGRRREVVQQPEERAPQREDAGAIELQQRGHVEPAREAPRAARQDNRLGSARDRVAQRLSERGDQRRVERVGGGPRQAQLADGTVLDRLDHDSVYARRARR